jgi:uncharacterized integral membrane protein
MPNDLHQITPSEQSVVAPATDAIGYTPPLHTRTAAAWFGICLAALVLVVLIVFMLQNTRTVEVTFLWMHGSLPLALALLVASVGTAIATMIVGVARITQLRRQSRRQHQAIA